MTQEAGLEVYIDEEMTGWNMTEFSARLFVTGRRREEPGLEISKVPVTLLALTLVMCGWWSLAVLSTLLDLHHSTANTLMP